MKHNASLHSPETQKRNRTTALANKTIYTLIWYAFYDLRPGNRVGPILTIPEPTKGTKCKETKASFYAI